MCCTWSNSKIKSPSSSRDPSHNTVSSALCLLTSLDVWSEMGKSLPGVDAASAMMMALSFRSPPSCALSKWRTEWRKEDTTARI